MQRNIVRFTNARKRVECGKISGAVGTFANTPPFVQDYVCEKLGIVSSNISTQVLQRDNHAEYFSTLALIASSLEKMAMEIRHLQRTEVREVEEYFNKGQKGSSAMPHKRNPISSENICGCSRVMRGYMLTSFEDIPLWHERDISHSAAERIISADSTELLDYMLVRFNKVIDNLTVFEDNMLKNIYITNGVIFSQRFMLKLVEKGLSREKAYDTVQPLAIKSWEENIQFRELMQNNETVKSILSNEDIEDCFALEHHLKNVDVILKRCNIL
jgi:adenylosuccinate lyase